MAINEIQSSRLSIPFIANEYISTGVNWLTLITSPTFPRRYCHRQHSSEKSTWRTHSRFYSLLIMLAICISRSTRIIKWVNEGTLIKPAGVQSSDSRKTSAAQSGRWEQHLGLFKSSPGSDLPTDRHALTAALIHFSRTLGWVHFCSIYDFA